jgi:CRP-like cAMP-binding protein
MKGVEDFLTVAGSFAELKEVSANRDIRTYQKKELIYQEDSYARGVFFVVKGKIKTFKTSEQGKELITGLYGENDFFGYHSLLENGRCTDSATALSTAEVCMIPKEDFFSLIFKNVQVSRSFIRLLSDNIREKEEQLVRLAYNSVRKRVAEAIMALYRRYHKGQAEPFSISISREDLASLAGTATETTIRTLSDFREESLVDVKGGTITVLDVDKLSRMKN